MPRRRIWSGLIRKKFIMGSNQCWLSKRIPSLLFLSMRQCNTIEHHGIKEEFDYTHLFKTDDDSYFNIDALYTELHTSQWWRWGCLLYKGIKGSDGAGKDHDYVGQCKLVHYEVHREAEYKWPLRVETNLICFVDHLTYSSIFINWSHNQYVNFIDDEHCKLPYIYYYQLAKSAANWKYQKNIMIKK